MRFSSAIQLARHGRPCFALQRCIPVAYKPLADAHDLPLAHANRRGNLVVRSAPVRVAPVGQQQDPGSPRNRGAHRLSAADRFKLLSLFGSKTNAHLVYRVRHPCLRNQVNGENRQWFTIP
jgi:hypothetical protein